MDSSLVDEALKEMDKQFWYLRKNGVEYYFDKEPQINKIIYDYMQEVSQREIKNKIKTTLETLLPKEDGTMVIVWDRERLEDNDMLKIFALDYEEKITQENEKEFLKQLLEYKPDGNIRDYQNSLVFVYADKYGIEFLADHARVVCAIERAQKDERIKVDKDNVTIIKARLGEAEGSLISECLNVYSKIAYPHLNDIRVDITSTLQSKSQNITDSVLGLLVRKGKLVNDLRPDAIDDVIIDKEKVVNYDLPWNPNKLEQRMGRIHRIGQDKSVYYYNFVINDTIDGSL